MIFFFESFDQIITECPDPQPKLIKTGHSALVHQTAKIFIADLSVINSFNLTILASYINNKIMLHP